MVHRELMCSVCALSIAKCVSTSRQAAPGSLGSRLQGAVRPLHFRIDMTPLDGR